MFLFEIIFTFAFFFFSTEPSDNMREILQNIAKSHGVSNMRKLGHLNNFVKVYINRCHFVYDFTWGYTIYFVQHQYCNVRLHNSQIAVTAMSGWDYTWQDDTVHKVRHYKSWSLVILRYATLSISREFKPFENKKL